jgi:hypothetical protein
MIVYNPLLMGVFTWLAFMLTSPEDTTCGSFQAAGAVPAHLVAGMG